MKRIYLIIILLMLAWPLYYLYQLQLGAISFFLLAIFFLVITVKEYKRQSETSNNHTNKEKMKQNNRLN